MISQFLIFVFSAVVFLSFLIGGAIFLHFKRFGLPADPIFKRIFNVFLIGSAIFIGFSAFFLILNLIRS